MVSKIVFIGPFGCEDSIIGEVLFSIYCLGAKIVFGCEDSIIGQVLDRYSGAKIVFIVQERRQYYWIGIRVQRQYLLFRRGISGIEVFVPFGCENSIYWHVRIFQLLKSLAGDTDECG